MLFQKEKLTSAQASGFARMNRIASTRKLSKFNVLQGRGF